MGVLQHMTNINQFALDEKKELQLKCDKFLKGMLNWLIEKKTTKYFHEVVESTRLRFRSCWKNSMQVM